MCLTLAGHVMQVGQVKLNTGSSEDGWMMQPASKGVAKARQFGHDFQS